MKQYLDKPALYLSLPLVGFTLALIVNIAVELFAEVNSEFVNWIGLTYLHLAVAVVSLLLIGHALVRKKYKLAGYGVLGILAGIGASIVLSMLFFITLVALFGLGVE
jgi:hypothetical protein